MANLILLSLFGLFFILLSLPCHALFKPFWRRPTNKPKPTLLPPADKDPEFYRKLREDIPPITETAKKVVKNLFHIRPGGKRDIQSEDVVIVMDGSGSIGGCEFGNGKKAMKNLMEYKQPNVDANYAMLTFSSGVRRDFNFLPQSVAAARISYVQFPGGSTNTQAGLAEAFKLMKQGSRGFDSRKVVILLTDGHSNQGKEKTVPMAQKLKEKGIEVFVVAVGGQHISGIDEMAHIATYPPANFLFRVKKVGDFLRIVNLAIKEVAPGQYKILDKYPSLCRG